MVQWCSGAVQYSGAVVQWFSGAVLQYSTVVQWCSGAVQCSAVVYLCDPDRGSSTVWCWQANMSTVDLCGLEN